MSDTHITAPDARAAQLRSHVPDQTDSAAGLSERKARLWRRHIRAGRRLPLDCAIRDISDGGARIVLAKRQPIPVDLYLIVVKFAVAYRASVVWLTFPARGLKFSAKYDLTAPLPDDLRFLHRLWAELGARNGITPSCGE